MIGLQQSVYGGGFLVLYNVWRQESVLWWTVWDADWWSPGWGWQGQIMVLVGRVLTGLSRVLSMSPTQSYNWHIHQETTPSNHLSRHCSMAATNLSIKFLFLWRHYTAWLKTVNCLTALSLMWDEYLLIWCLLTLSTEYIIVSWCFIICD